MQENRRALEPLARSDQLLIRELHNELLVYDLNSHQAHCLNQTAARVWNACNGRRTPGQITEFIRRETNSQIRPEIVSLTLEELDKSHLLVGEQPVFLPVDGISRRELVLRLGVGAAIALPVVTSLVAPKAAQASTCLSSGATCSTSAQCCSGLCSGTVCA